MNNFLIGDGVKESDKDIFFGGGELEEKFVRLGDKATWADIAVEMGIFVSKTQARKNGYGGEIVDGWTDTETENPIRRKRTGIGKLNKRVCILKIL